MTSSLASSGKKIAIAMSGGVDSSVVAHLLRQQFPSSNSNNGDKGNMNASTSKNNTSTKLIGVHMSNWDFDEENISTIKTNCWEQDWKDAQAVADHVGLDDMIHTSFQAEYWNAVFEPFIQQVSSQQQQQQQQQQQHTHTHTHTNQQQQQQQHQTPNPDVNCNRYIKFGVLKEFLQTNYQIDTLATGHYARLWDPIQTPIMPECLQQIVAEDPSILEIKGVFGNGNGFTNFGFTGSSNIGNNQTISPLPMLLAAKDLTKDQSYFLSSVPGEAFRNVLFPLGDYLKTTTTTTTTKTSSKDDMNNNRMSREVTVRQLATDAKLPNATKRDSMGICFIGKRNHGEFISDFVESPNPDVIGRCINVEDGSIVSTFHPEKQPSLLYATIGQGAKIGGATQKWFVVDKPDATTIMICPGTHHPALYSDSFQLDEIHWISGIEPTLPLRAQCRIRHLQPLMGCEIRRSSSAARYEIVTDSPLRGIAPGQICGLYMKDLICLGGGPITQRSPSYMDLNKDLPTYLHPAGNNDLSTTAKRKRTTAATK